MAAHGGHTRASGGRTVKMNVHVRLPFINSQSDMEVVSSFLVSQCVGSVLEVQAIQLYIV